MAAEIAILGSYPPPYGGAANHVFRLCHQLRRRGISYVVYNAVNDAHDGDRVVSVKDHRSRWMLQYLATAQERVIYCLSDRLAAWAVTAALERLRGKRTIIRLRNANLSNWLTDSPRRASAAGALLRGVSGVVAVSEHLGVCAERVGVPRERVHWAPGFLPPHEDEFDPSGMPPGVMEFLARREPRIAASVRILWHNGEDLYGLDMLVELARRLRHDYPRLGIVACFYEHGPSEEPRLEQLKRAAAQAGVAESIFFSTRTSPFLPALARAEVLVRPTNTDGDANTVREALSLGIPAVASDAVSRPPGTIVFRSRDDDDFEAKVRVALERRASSSRTPAEVPGVDDYISFLLSGENPRPPAANTGLEDRVDER